MQNFATVSAKAPLKGYLAAAMFRLLPLKIVLQQIPLKADFLIAGRG
jgi:hypothetical protein